VPGDRPSLSYGEQMLALDPGRMNRSKGAQDGPTQLADRVRHQAGAGNDPRPGTDNLHGKTWQSNLDFFLK
jgi:hypothetical protein